MYVHSLCLLTGRESEINVINFICFLVILKSEVSVHPQFASAHWESDINVIHFICFLIILKSEVNEQQLFVSCHEPKSKRCEHPVFTDSLSQIKGRATVLCLPLTGNKKCLVCTIPTTQPKLKCLYTIVRLSHSTTSQSCCTL